MIIVVVIIVVIIIIIVVFVIVIVVAYFLNCTGVPSSPVTLGTAHLVGWGSSSLLSSLRRIQSL